VVNGYFNLLGSLLALFIFNFANIHITHHFKDSSTAVSAADEL
jgi:hypothetical protein